MNYQQFLDAKRTEIEPSGFEVSNLHPDMFDFQEHVCRQSLYRGKNAIFLDCGMGKALILLEWARKVAAHTHGKVLIVAPLGVTSQIKIEAEKFRIPLLNDVIITNYERLHKLDPTDYQGIALDESSILKNPFGMTKNQLIEFGSHISHRICASATPAPNDYEELLNHAEFLGVMTAHEAKGLYFIQDGNSSNKFRLKHHSVGDFWQWVSEWSIAARKPSDLGFSDESFILPELHIEQHVVDVNNYQAGTLFAMEAVTLSEQRKANKASLDNRCEAAAKIANGTNEPVLVWCNTNDESATLKKLIHDSVEVKGSDSIEHKEDALTGFGEGRYRVLVTKPSIAGFGMNYQHCNTSIFVGLSHSFEQYYQAIRRNWRFGQGREVTAHIITSTADGRVKQNIERKQSQMIEMFDQIIENVSPFQGATTRNEMKIENEIAEGDNYKLYLGDSVEEIDKIDSESVGVSTFSPPFPGMYVYSNSASDMGNVTSIEQMIEQFSYLMGPDKMMRVMMPGRSVLIHITQGVAQKGRDGYIGLKDFRGPLINMMQGHGWHYYGEITIDKNPQVKAQRTKDHGLMFKTLNKDSANMHMAMPDIVLQFRKPGDNPNPIKAGTKENEKGWITNEEWILWARPTWYASDYLPGTWTENSKGEACPWGISEGDVLSNYRNAKGQGDERHLCPLQLGVIERCIKLWSAPGETVFSPFAGIGSEGHQAIIHNRKFIGIELKRSYWNQAISNLEAAQIEKAKLNNTLFDLAEVS